MEELRAEYLNKHLPYRLNSLLAPDLITHRRNTIADDKLKSSCYQDSLVLEPAFEISIVFGRALLQFIGITYDISKNDLAVFNPIDKKGDFTLKSLFPERAFCPLDDEIVIQNKKALCVIMKVANKSVAHMTTTFASPDEHSLLESARKAIYKLILKHVPEINKDKIWWYTQVENN